MNDDETRHAGRGLGSFEELVAHEDGDATSRSDPPLQVRKLWNPVTYRCSFCAESFVSRAMIRRHLERHAAEHHDSGRRAA